MLIICLVFHKKNQGVLNDKQVWLFLQHFSSTSTGKTQDGALASTAQQLDWVVTAWAWQLHSQNWTPGPAWELDKTVCGKKSEFWTWWQNWTPSYRSTEESELNLQIKINKGLLLRSTITDHQSCSKVCSYLRYAKVHFFRAGQWLIAFWIIQGLFGLTHSR